jgi:hypothetical protein
MDSPNRSTAASSPRRLSRQEGTLLALGLATWVALAIGGAWLLHQFTRPTAACGYPLEARGAQLRSPAPSPHNTLQLLTGTGRCR